MTKHLTLSLFIGVALGASEKEKNTTPPVDKW